MIDDGRKYQIRGSLEQRTEDAKGGEAGEDFKNDYLIDNFDDIFV